MHNMSLSLFGWMLMLCGIHTFSNFATKAQCRDTPLDWESSLGTCLDFRLNQLCTSDGDFGVGWNRDLVSSFPEVGSVGPTEACCVCGGGIVTGAFKVNTGDTTNECELRHDFKYSPTTYTQCLIYGYSSRLSIPINISTPKLPHGCFENKSEFVFFNEDPTDTASPQAYKVCYGGRYISSAVGNCNGDSIEYITSKQECADAAKYLLLPEEEIVEIDSNTLLPYGCYNFPTNPDQKLWFNAAGTKQSTEPNVFSLCRQKKNCEVWPELTKGDALSFFQKVSITTSGCCARDDTSVGLTANVPCNLIQCNATEAGFVSGAEECALLCVFYTGFECLSYELRGSLPGKKASYRCQLKTFSANTINNRFLCFEASTTMCYTRIREYTRPIMSCAPSTSPTPSPSLSPTLKEKLTRHPSSAPSWSPTVTLAPTSPPVAVPSLFTVFPSSPPSLLLSSSTPSLILSSSTIATTTLSYGASSSPTLTISTSPVSSSPSSSSSHVPTTTTTTAGGPIGLATSPPTTIATIITDLSTFSTSTSPSSIPSSSTSSSPSPSLSPSPPSTLSSPSSPLSPTSSRASVTPTVAPSTPDQGSSSSSSSFPVIMIGAIGGGVAIIVVMLVCCLVCACKGRKQPARKKKELSKTEAEAYLNFTLAPLGDISPLQSSSIATDQMYDSSLSQSTLYDTTPTTITTGTAHSYAVVAEDYATNNPIFDKTIDGYDMPLAEATSTSGGSARAKHEATVEHSTTMPEYHDIVDLHNANNNKHNNYNNNNNNNNSNNNNNNNSNNHSNNSSSSGSNNNTATNNSTTTTANNNNIVINNVIGYAIPRELGQTLQLHANLEHESTAQGTSDYALPHSDNIDYERAVDDKIDYAKPTKPTVVNIDEDADYETLPVTSVGYARPQDAGVDNVKPQDPGVDNVKQHDAGVGYAMPQDAGVGVDADYAIATTPHTNSTAPHTNTTTPHANTAIGANTNSPHVQPPAANINSIADSAKVLTGFDYARVLPPKEVDYANPDDVISNSVIPIVTNTNSNTNANAKENANANTHHTAPKEGDYANPDDVIFDSAIPIVTNTNANTHTNTNTQYPAPKEFDYANPDDLIRPIVTNTNTNANAQYTAPVSVPRNDVGIETHTRGGAKVLTGFDYARAVLEELEYANVDDVKTDPAIPIPTNTNTNTNTDANTNTHANTRYAAPKEVNYANPDDLITGSTPPLPTNIPYTTPVNVLRDEHDADADYETNTRGGDGVKVLAGADYAHPRYDETKPIFESPAYDDTSNGLANTFFPGSSVATIPTFSTEMLYQQPADVAVYYNDNDDGDVAVAHSNNS